MEKNVLRQFIEEVDNVLNKEGAINPRVVKQYSEDEDTLKAGYTIYIEFTNTENKRRYVAYFAKKENEADVLYSQMKNLCKKYL